jgi:hypothetical protein
MGRRMRTSLAFNEEPFGFDFDKVETRSTRKRRF